MIVIGARRIRDTRPENRWEIRHRFRDFRRQTGMTQKRLGRIMGMWHQSISNIERAHTFPGPHTWLRFEELERTYARNRHRDRDQQRFIEDIRRAEQQRAL